MKRSYEKRNNLSSDAAAEPTDGAKQGPMSLFFRVAFHPLGAPECKPRAAGKPRSPLSVPRVQRQVFLAVMDAILFFS